MVFTQEATRNLLRREHPITAPILRLLFFYLSSLLIAAIVTPLIFNLAVHWNAQFPNALNTYLMRKGFVVFFDRIRLIALLFFFPALWKMYRWEAYRSIPDRFDCRNFRLFFILGMGLIAGIWGIKMLFLDFTLRAPSFFFLLKTLIRVLLIALLEEWLFRGLIFNLLLRRMRPAVAFVVSAFIFAHLHFRPTLSVASGLATFYDGFYCLYEVIFRSLVGISWFKFLILFSLGYLLATVYFYTRKLGAAVGIHAGIIFSLAIFKTCVSFSAVHSFFGSDDLFDSPLALLVIIAATVFSHGIVKRVGSDRLP
ncbi:MAG: CPBP family intramembrane metalloprotease [Puniceicoccales bacterium]|jgi:membrane protease YdiL (CAAX protease family)|nr:CPBP family intramembrane metalloprotease [Puniceicoccales bacterium]